MNMNKTIFIIEEDLNILSSLESLLSLLGFSVESYYDFSTEEEVLNKIIFSNPDFIILEPGIRNIDGFSLLSGLKSNRETVEKPVFVFTGLDDVCVKEKAEKLGAEYYFHKKDHGIQDFVNKVKKIIINKFK